MRGHDEHYKLQYGDLQLKSASDGSRYVEFSECDTKTRSGEASDTRPFKPKCGTLQKTLRSVQCCYLRSILHSDPQKCANWIPHFI